MFVLNVHQLRASACRTDEDRNAPFSQDVLACVAATLGMISSEATDEYGPGPEMSTLRWLGAEDDPAGRVRNAV